MIDKVKTIVLQRVRFHAPICFDANVSALLLKNNKINPNLPIFVYKKELNKVVLKAFEKAQLEENFNLIIPIENVTKKAEKTLESLPYCTLYSEKNSPLPLVSLINKLNINYSAKARYALEYREKFFKIGEEVLNPSYHDFCLQKTGKVGQVEFLYREFLLNGANFLVTLKNNGGNEAKVPIEINLPLKKGYYLFKRKQKSVSVYNLMTGETFIFSYFCQRAEFSFSCISGLENSSFSTINLRAKLSLKAGEERTVFFQMSKKKLPLSSPKEFERFFQLAIRKSMEIFDVRVKTKNAKFDQFFNVTLPKKISLGWLNGEDVKALSEKYITLRRLFVRGKEKISILPYKEIGLKELGIFNGEYYKKIIVGFGEEEFLKVGKVKFCNVNNITKHSLTKGDAIYLSFN